MKAKQVYEFVKKKSLKKTIQNDIGIKFKIKKEIEEWFEKFDPEAEYIIDDNLNVKTPDLYIIGEDNLINFPMDKLEITENFFRVRRCNNLESLPNELILSGKDNAKISVSVNPKLTKFFDKIYIKNKNIDISLMIAYTLITELPKDIKKYNNLDIRGTKIKEIPNNISIRGQIIITPEQENLINRGLIKFPTEFKNKIKII